MEDHITEPCTAEDDRGECQCDGQQPECTAPIRMALPAQAGSISASHITLHFPAPLQTPVLSHTSYGPHWSKLHVLFWSWTHKMNRPVL